jgi:hypothetical protein
MLAARPALVLKMDDERIIDRVDTALVERPHVSEDYRGNEGWIEETVCKVCGETLWKEYDGYLAAYLAPCAGPDAK